MTWAVTTLQQWLLFSSAALMVGCIVWRIHIGPQAALALGSNDGEALRGVALRVARLGLSAAFALVLAWVLRFVAQIMGFRDPFVPLSEDVSFLLFQTSWGTIWMIQGGVLILLLGALVSTRRGPLFGDEAAEPGLGPLNTGWKAAALLALGLTATLAYSSHAAGVDSGRTFALMADGLHSLSAGAWIGSLAVILLAGRAHSAAAPGVFGAQIRSFSPVALVSGVTLVAMGGFLSWTHLVAVSDLWSTTYGRILSGKVSVVVLILALGYWNWQKGLPRADQPEGAADVRRRAIWEVSLAVGVILLTAILVHSPKP